MGYRDTAFMLNRLQHRSRLGESKLRVLLRRWAGESSGPEKSTQLRDDPAARCDKTPVHVVPSRASDDAGELRGAQDGPVVESMSSSPCHIVHVVEST